MTSNQNIGMTIRIGHEKEFGDMQFWDLDMVHKECNFGKIVFPRGRSNPTTFFRCERCGVERELGNEDDKAKIVSLAMNGYTEYRTLSKEGDNLVFFTVEGIDGYHPDRYIPETEKLELQKIEKTQWWQFWK